MPEPKFTPTQIKELYLTHPNNTLSNVVTWKDTWKIAGVIAVLTASMATFALTIISDKIKAETEVLVLKNNEELRKELIENSQKYNDQPKGGDVSIK